MSSTPSLPTDKPEVAFLLAQLGAHAATLFAEKLKPIKLTPPQAGILRLINCESGISQQRLAKLLGMYASRMVAVLDEMERLKLVERKASPNDRRFYALHLTEREKRNCRRSGKWRENIARPCVQRSAQRNGIP